jgi:hypothetical protein
MDLNPAWSQKSADLQSFFAIALEIGPNRLLRPIEERLPATAAIAQTATQRRRLAVKGKILGREITTLFTRDTILR